MSSQLFSKSHFDFAKGLVFFGFPLHAPGKLTIDRADHLKDVKVPMLFIQGTRDELANWSLIEKVTNELSLATLCKIEGANHAFKSGKQNLIPVIAQATKEWIERI
jgi:predicted alpha/beta-hydrolase family hydrolase